MPALYIFPLTGHFSEQRKRTIGETNSGLTFSRIPGPQGTDKSRHIFPDAIAMASIPVPVERIGHRAVPSDQVLS